MGKQSNTSIYQKKIKVKGKKKSDLSLFKYSITQLN